MRGRPSPTPPVGLSIPESFERELKAYDPRLGVLFDRRRERWTIATWVEAWQRWSEDFCWQGEKGEYRQLPATAGPVIEYLAKIDLDLLPGSARLKRDVLSEQCDAVRTSYLRARNRERLDALKQYLPKMLSAANNAHGNKHARRMALGGSPEHRRFMQEWLKRGSLAG